MQCSASLLKSSLLLGRHRSPWASAIDSRRAFTPWEGLSCPTEAQQDAFVEWANCCGVYRAETVEEKDLRVRAEKRAQVTSLATLSLLLIASSLFLFLTYTGW